MADKPIPTRSSSRESSSRGSRPFATTQWSLVLAAGLRANPQSEAALASLCATYWYPLYAYVRRRGYAPDEAQDLTQDFFAYLLEKNRLQAADKARGKFRSFLLTSLQNFLARHWRKTQTKKRGGGRFALSLDFSSGEQKYQLEPAHETTPEKIFERRWALTLLDKVMARLRDEYVAQGKTELFESLKGHLGGETAPYAELGESLAISEGAARVAVHRLRRRCREVLRAEIAETVEGANEIDDELRCLFATLRIDA
jgi:RNA polymerase sigma factor (sigma-70 family)